MDTAVPKFVSTFSFHNLFHLVQGEVPSNDTRSKKLRETQCSPKLAFRSTDFCVPENLVFPELNRGPSKILTFIPINSQFAAIS